MISGILSALAILALCGLLIAMARYRQNRMPRYIARPRRASLAELLRPEPWQRRPFDLIPQQPSESQPAVHLTPDYDSDQVTACCGLPLSAIPAGEGLSGEPEQVTCGRGES